MNNQSFQNAKGETAFKRGMRIKLPEYLCHGGEWATIRYVEHAGSACCETDAHWSVFVGVGKISDCVLDLAPEYIWEGREYKNRCSDKSCRVVFVSDDYIAFVLQTGHTAMWNRRKFLSEWEPTPLPVSEVTSSSNEPDERQWVIDELVTPLKEILSKEATWLDRVASMIREQVKRFDRIPGFKEFSDAYLKDAYLKDAVVYSERSNAIRNILLDVEAQLEKSKDEPQVALHPENTACQTLADARAEINALRKALRDQAGVTLIMCPTCGKRSIEAKMGQCWVCQQAKIEHLENELSCSKDAVRTGDNAIMCLQAEIDQLKETKR